jgi:hypothetical protein
MRGLRWFLELIRPREEEYVPPYVPGAMCEVGGPITIGKAWGEDWEAAPTFQDMLSSDGSAVRVPPTPIWLPMDELQRLWGSPAPERPWLSRWFGDTRDEPEVLLPLSSYPSTPSDYDELAKRWAAEHQGWTVEWEEPTWDDLDRPWVFPPLDRVPALTYAETARALGYDPCPTDADDFMAYMKRVQREAWLAHDRMLGFSINDPKKIINIMGTIT